VAGASESVRTVEFGYDVADLRQAVQANRPPRSTTLALTGLGVIVGLTLLVVGLMGSINGGGRGWVTLTIVGVAVTGIATMKSIRLQSRHRAALFQEGGLVAVTVGDTFDYACGGVSIKMAWNDVRLQRTPSAIVVFGPHALCVVVPSHASASAAEFEWLCADIARHVHQAQGTA